MFTTGGERPLVPMALLSAAKLAVIIGIFCSVVAVEGRPDDHFHHLENPGPGQGASLDSGRYAVGSNNTGHARTYLLAVHGIIASLAFIILFPLGSILIRLLPGRMALFAHAFWQLLTLLVYMAAVGLGIHGLKGNSGMKHSDLNYHPIIGIFVLGLLFIQPLVGIFHHKEYKVSRRRGFWSALHLIIGRVSITVGMIDGYLGLVSNEERSRKLRIIYVTVALALWLLWTAMSMWWEWKRHRRERSEKELERALAEDGTGVGADRGINGLRNGRPVNDQSETRARDALRKAKRSRV